MRPRQHNTSTLGFTILELYISQIASNPLLNIPPNPHQVRMTDWDLSSTIIETLTLNAEFNAEIVTEYAFNALGILEKVGTCGRGCYFRV